MMNHFVITRFNIPVSYSTTRNQSISNIDYIRDETYLDYRFQLFETYTFPSLKNQTCSNFTWFVLFHTDTPFKYKKKLAELQKEMPQFIPLFLTDEESLDYNNVIRQKMYEYSQYDTVIATRIDNDDCFHESYLQTIQEIARKGHSRLPYIINYSTGLVYLQKTQYTRRVEYPDNHFLSILSERERIISPIEFNHGKCSQLYPVNNISRPNNPMWIEIVHSTNITNQVVVQIFKSVVNPSIFKGFHVNIYWTPLGYCKIVIVSIIPTLKNAIKKISKKLKH